MAAMTTRDLAARAAATLLLLAASLLVGCAGGPSHEHARGEGAVATTVTPASEIIAMHERGADEQALLDWVNEPSRTFDLTEDDVGNMVFAGVSERVVNAAMARSDEHHARSGHSHDHDHGHGHSH